MARPRPAITTHEQSDYKVEQSSFTLKPGFHKANFDHDNDQFSVKTKRLAGGMTAQPHNRFVFCVVVVEFAVNGNQVQSL